MKNNIKEELNNLKYEDIYSMMLFALYKLQGVPEYALTSELVYLLDRDSLHNMLEYFGGMTIRIPTIDELKNIINALLLYQFTNIDNMKIEDAIAELSEGIPQSQLSKVIETHAKLSSILSEYDFKRN